jgi:histidinol dehydrogenase
MIRLIKGSQKNFLSKLNFILDKRKSKDNNIDLKIKLIIKDIKKNKDIALIDLAYNRILNFHKKQKLSSFSYTDRFENSFSYKSKPIDKVGIYVPGGLASYPSSVLMNCIPAIVAGVKNIFMATPSMSTDFNPAVIYAAKKCKVKEIYKVGGAQAIAAMAYGTNIVNKVDKIVGPGNAFVAAAKKQVFGDVGIDMIAGPSEITIVADKWSKPDWIAADLIAQAEHDESAQSIIISDDLQMINKVNYFLNEQLKVLPKKKIASKSLKNFGLSILVKNKKLLIETINLIAPEHLEIFTRKPNQILKNVKNAGSIFIGQYSPEAIGDYLAGPNHVLPTSGSARFSSGLSVYDFLKRYSVIKMTKSGIERLGTSVINLAEYENLEGHANSIKIRLKKGKK